jgi:hypothetical protein
MTAKIAKVAKIASFFLIPFLAFLTKTLHSQIIS